MDREDIERRAKSIFNFVELSLKNGNKAQAQRSIERALLSAYLVGEKNGKSKSHKRNAA